MSVAVEEVVATDPEPDPLAREDAELQAEAETLGARRAEIALDVVLGDSAAQTELAEIDERLGDIAIRRELLDLGARERARREEEAQARQEAERIAALNAAGAEAYEQKRAHLLAFAVDLERLTHSARRLIDADDAVNDLIRELGEKVPATIRDTVVAHTVLALADIDRATRHRVGDYPDGKDGLRLREQLAEWLAEAKATPAAETRCTVCTSPQRAEIEQAVAEGSMSQVKIAERFGLSRSALQRHHEKHASTPPAVEAGDDE